METTEVSQICNECEVWRNNLRSLRDEFNQHQKELLTMAAMHPEKEVQKEIEHFQNQFHIQLINIHDLKQAVKAQDRKIRIQQSMHGGVLTEEVYTDHELLYEQVQKLDQIIQEIRNEFRDFLEQTS